MPTCLLGNVPEEDEKSLELYLANFLPLEHVFIHFNRNTSSMYSIYINPSPPNLLQTK